MANSLKGRTWELDTAAATPIKGNENAVLTSGFVFYNYSTDGDDCIFQDEDGQVVAHLKGNAALSPVGWAFAEPTWIRGLTLTTLDSGKAQVVAY